MHRCRWPVYSEAKSYTNRTIVAHGAKRPGSRMWEWARARTAGTFVPWNRTCGACAGQMRWSSYPGSYFGGWQCCGAQMAPPRNRSARALQRQDRRKKAAEAKAEALPLALAAKASKLERKAVAFKGLGGAKVKGAGRKAAAAAGLGDRADSEREARKLKQLELQALINEKKAELERLSAQHDSLTRVEAEQKALIEKLTNNEA